MDTKQKKAFSSSYLLVFNNITALTVFARISKNHKQYVKLCSIFTLLTKMIEAIHYRAWLHCLRIHTKANLQSAFPQIKHIQRNKKENKLEPFEINEALRLVFCGWPFSVNYFVTSHIIAWAKNKKLTQTRFFLLLQIIKWMKNILITAKKNAFLISRCVECLNNIFLFILECYVSLFELLLFWVWKIKKSKVNKMYLFIIKIFSPLNTRAQFIPRKYDTEIMSAMRRDPK